MASTRLVTKESLNGLGRGMSKRQRVPVEFSDFEGLIRHMIDKSGKTGVEVSGDIGRSGNYIWAMLRNGTTPRADLLASIAAACGYELVLSGHGETILVSRADGGGLGIKSQLMRSFYDGLQLKHASPDNLNVTLIRGEDDPPGDGFALVFSNDLKVQVVVSYEVVRDLVSDPPDLDGSDMSESDLLALNEEWIEEASRWPDESSSQPS